MKVKRIICPICHEEKGKVVEEEDNLHSYQEEEVYEPCKKCSSTPEDRLLTAILGGTNE